MHQSRACWRAHRVYTYLLLQELRELCRPSAGGKLQHLADAIERIGVRGPSHGVQRTEQRYVRVWLQSPSYFLLAYTMFSLDQPMPGPVFALAANLSDGIVLVSATNPDLDVNGTLFGLNATDGAIMWRMVAVNTVLKGSHGLRYVPAVDPVYVVNVCAPAAAHDCGF